MKQLTKRTLSVLISLLMMLSTLAGLQLTAYATTIAQGVSWAESKVGYRVGGGQCTDLVTAYWNYMGYNTYCNSGYKYPSGQGSMPPGSTMVVYKSGVTALAGDVAVYSKGWKGGSYGHVAIVTSATSSGMTVVEQYGSTDHLTHKNNIGYNRGDGYVLYGFIRLSGAQGGTQVTPVPQPIPPSISLSTSSVSLNLSNTKTATVTATVAGDLPSVYHLSATTSNGNIKCNWGAWSGNNQPLTITGAQTGSTTLRIDLINNNNNAVLASKTITVNVTANTYTISFNANGGTGAPSPVRTDYKGVVTLPTTKPTSNEVNTVTFDANGGTLPTGLKTSYKKYFDYWYDNAGNKYYPNGNAYTFKAHTTLYAHYSYETLYAKNAIKPNYYFLGWYDSKDWNYGPKGNQYIIGSSRISKNMTLYAMWGTSKTRMFGDANRDDKLDDTDGAMVYQLTIGSITLKDSDWFFMDVDADGKVTTNDQNEILSVCRFKTKNYSDLNAVKNCTGVSVKSISKTNYAYGEEFDYDGIVLQSNYTGSSVHHTISSDYIVTGYDPYKVGTQTVTINFYQYSTTANVTVQAPTYTLSLNANGGFVSDPSKTVTYGQNFGTLPTPEKEGYTFNGWYTAESGGTKVSSSTALTSLDNQTVYAHWTKSTYSLSYDANGGSNCPANASSIGYDTSYKVSSTVPTKAGYIFKGWSLTNESNGDYIYPNDSIVVKDNLKLYAIFEEPQFLEEAGYVEGHVLTSSPEVFRFIAPKTGNYFFYSYGASNLTPTIKLGNVAITKSFEVNDDDGFSFVAKLTEGQVYTLNVSSNANNYFGVSVNNCENVEHEHIYKQKSATKATTSASGVINSYCTFCEATKKTTVAQIKTVTLSATKYTYDAKAKKPTVTVKDSKGNKISSSNYTVTYSNNTNVGKATVKVTFKGNYSGTVTKTFVINPKGTTISSLTAVSKGFTAKWKKQATQTTGYQIRYSTKSSMASAKTVTVSSASTVSKKITGLTAKKKYFVQIRTYKTVNGTKYYSSWSATKSITVR